MSVYDGKGKGAKRRRRDERYWAAVGRQMLLHDRGFYRRLVIDHTSLRFLDCKPAPVEEFLRPEHRDLVADPGIDWRSYARASQRT